MSFSSFLDNLYLVLVSHLVSILIGQLVKRGTSLILTLNSVIYMLDTHGNISDFFIWSLLAEHVADTVWFSFYMHFLRAFNIHFNLILQQVFYVFYVTLS